MASRAKQKEEARQRRLAEERERAERQRSQRRLRMVGGVVVAAVAVAVVIVVIASGGKNSSALVKPQPGSVKLPSLQNTNLASAAKAAGCVITDTPDSIARTDQNRTHVSPGTKVHYATN